MLGSFAGTGLAYGAMSALVPAVTADLVGHRAFPRMYGRVFTGWGCAGLAARLVAGAVTGSGGRSPAFALVVAGPLVPAAIALLLLGRRTAARGAPAGSPTP